jgi:hypothetical protein
VKHRIEMKCNLKVFFLLEDHLITDQRTEINIQLILFYDSFIPQKLKCFFFSILPNYLFEIPFLILMVQ